MNAIAMRDKAILDYLTDSQWAIEPTVLERLIGIVSRHAEGVKLTDDQVEQIVAARGSDPRREAGEYRIEGSTAIVPIFGVIAKYAHQVNGVSQLRGTSVERIRENLDTALGDGNVRTILLHIESPGGAVYGIADLADAIRAAGERKPVTAYADDLAASAAYWLGSQAMRFWGNRTAAVGSIGVYSVVPDSSAMAERMGLRYTVIRSAPYKGVASPGTEVEAEDLKGFQQRVDAVHGVFVADVARGRGMDAEEASQIADGRTFTGVEAVAAGLIDGIKTLRQAIASAKPATRATGAKATAEGFQQTEQHQQVQQTEQAQVKDPRKENAMEKQSEATETQAQASEIEAAKRQATQGERERISAIEKALGGMEALGDLRSRAIADGTGVLEVKAEGFEVLKAHLEDALAKKDEELASAKDANARMSKLLGSRGVTASDIAEFDASDVQKPEDGKQAASAGDDDGKAETYEAALEANLKAGQKKSLAHRNAGVEFPKSFEAWKTASQ